MSTTVIMMMFGLIPGMVYPQERQTLRDPAVVREFKRTVACPSTGKKDAYAPCVGFVADHMLSLCMGGKDIVENIAWQEVKASYRKDVEERRICARIAELEKLKTECLAK